MNTKYLIKPVVLLNLLFSIHCVCADDFYQLKGYNYMMKYKYEEAITEYKKSLSMYPDNAKTYYNLGLCYQMLDLPSKALSHFQKAIEINPDYEKAYCNLGEIYGTSGEWDKAKFYLDKALKINSECINAYVIYGNLYFISKKYDQAIPYLKKAKNLMQIKEDYQFLDITEAMLISSKEEIEKKAD